MKIEIQEGMVVNNRLKLKYKNWNHKSLKKTAPYVLWFFLNSYYICQKNNCIYKWNNLHSL